VKSEAQVELVSHAAIWVVVGLFTVGLLVGLLGFLMR
jgi:hypothetical protein